jgi:hypothetical protein
MQATRGPYTAPILLEWTAIWILACCSDVRAAQEETLSGPDSHETPLLPSQYLLGDWNGTRSYLSERGVRFDLQYIRDSLSNIESNRNERFVSWNRFRGTVDIDFEPLAKYCTTICNSVGPIVSRTLNSMPCSVFQVVELP